MTAIPVGRNGRHLNLELSGHRFSLVLSGRRPGHYTSVRVLVKPTAVHGPVDTPAQRGAPIRSVADHRPICDSL